MTVINFDIDGSKNVTLAKNIVFNIGDQTSMAEKSPMCMLMLTNSTNCNNFSNADEENQDENNHRYVGLVNQAMTCYLNSLIQTLYMTPEFRNAIYEWKFSGKVENEAINLPYQLQKLFLHLQTSEKSSLETKELTASFGWDSNEAYDQHDVQELCRIMFDALEHRWRNSKNSSVIQDLYKGTMEDYVKCHGCGEERAKKDVFLDLPLSIKPFGSNMTYKSIEEALSAFIKPEELNGSNQYECEKCGSKQDAEKGLRITGFPKLLTIQLKRFDFDYQTMHRIKLNSRITFPDYLDVNNYIYKPPVPEPPKMSYAAAAKKPKPLLQPGCSSDENPPEDPFTSPTTSSSNTDQTQSSTSTFEVDDDKNVPEWLNVAADSFEIEEMLKRGPFIYELFSIMIHQGNATAGHYFAYIKNLDQNRWFCFNDSSVQVATMSDIYRSFGGSSYGYANNINAYMLMYRKADLANNQHFIRTPVLPQHLKDLYTKLKIEEEERERKQRYDQELIKLHYICNEERCLAEWLSRDPELKNPDVILIHKDVSLDSVFGTLVNKLDEKMQLQSSIGGEMSGQRFDLQHSSQNVRLILCDNNWEMKGIAVQYPADKMAEMATVDCGENNREKFENADEGGESSNFVVGGDEEYKKPLETLLPRGAIYNTFYKHELNLMIDTKPNDSDEYNSNSEGMRKFIEYKKHWIQLRIILPTKEHLAIITQNLIELERRKLAEQAENTGGSSVNVTTQTSSQLALPRPIAIVPPTIVQQSPKTAQSTSTATAVYPYPMEPTIEDPTLPPPPAYSKTDPPPAHCNTAYPIDRPRTARGVQMRHRSGGASEEDRDLEEETAEEGGGDGHETVKRKAAANERAEHLGRPKSARAFRFDDNTERSDEYDSVRAELDAGTGIYSAVPLPDLNSSMISGQDQNVVPSFDDPIQQQGTQKSTSGVSIICHAGDDVVMGGEQEEEEDDLQSGDEGEREQLLSDDCGDVDDPMVDSYMSTPKISPVVSEASGDECVADYGVALPDCYGRFDARRQQLTEKQMRIDEKMCLFANDNLREVSTAATIATTTERATTTTEMESRGEADDTMTNPGGTGTAAGATHQNRLDLELAAENNDTLVEGGTDSSDTAAASPANDLLPVPAPLTTASCNLLKKKETEEEGGWGPQGMEETAAETDQQQSEIDVDKMARETIKLIKYCDENALRPYLLLNLDKRAPAMIIKYWLSKYLCMSQDKFYINKHYDESENGFLFEPNEYEHIHDKLNWNNHLSVDFPIQFLINKSATADAIEGGSKESDNDEDKAGPSKDSNPPIIGCQNQQQDSNRWKRRERPLRIKVMSVSESDDVG